MKELKRKCIAIHPIWKQRCMKGPLHKGFHQTEKREEEPREATWVVIWK